jgi:putative two-component system response regulator
MEMLELEGYQVHTASNGQEALGVMQIVTPDLILSDIAMPEMDGYTFFRMVREKPEWVVIPIIFLTARGEKEDILSGKDLGVEDYLVKPVTREDLLIAVNSRLQRSQQLRVVQLQQAYETSLTVLANAIEVRDQYTRGHVERVMAYAFAIAENLDTESLDADQLRFGAMLHDIGKIHIRESTLSKRDSLSEDERLEIVKHPMSGAEMIKDIPYLAQAIPVIRGHHERWDGLGYPLGLKNEQIPLAARIVAIADCFDAMTTARPYNQARSLEEAYMEILNNAGSLYDPGVVEAFRKAWKTRRIQTIANGMGE